MADPIIKVTTNQVNVDVSTNEPTIEFTIPSQTIINGGVWGAIDGDLENQLDLKTALDSKENIANKVTDLANPNDVTYATTSAIANALALIDQALSEINSALSGKQDTIVNSDSITEGSSHLFLTTTERNKLANTSGVNTGDQDLSNYVLTSNLSNIAFTGNYSDINNPPVIPDQLSDLSDDSTHRLATDTEKSTWNAKQNALVSGTNIKTINNNSLLGAGDLTVITDVSGLVPYSGATGNVSLGSYSITASNLSGNNTGDQDLSNYTLTSNLSNVAFSGNYSDLTNKPSIPTSHAQLSDIGTNTHAQIDTALTRLANTSNTNTGDLVLGNSTNGLTLSGQTLQLGLASGNSSGALSSTDWTTFNNKQSTLTNPITGTGASGRIALFDGNTTLTSDADYTYDSTNNIVNLTGYQAIRQGALNDYNFRYLKPDGTTLFQANYDSSNFHHYLGTNANYIFNLAQTNNAFIINGVSASSNNIFRINNTITQFEIDITGNIPKLTIGGLGYATAATQLVTNFIAVFQSFAWNGSNGSSVTTGIRLYLRQLTAANNSAVFDLMRDDGTRLVSILTSSCNLGIRNDNPTAQLHVINSTASQPVTRFASAVSPSTDQSQWLDSSGNVKCAIDQKWGFRPVSMTDADALNNSIYYSTTQSKLVYKDSGGVINNLY